MAEPITDLKLVWSPLVGITMSWTDATDVTVDSVYKIYVYDNTLSTPDWRVWQNGSAYPYRATGSAVVTLLPPASTYMFPWSEMLVLTKNNTPPRGVSFKIVHVDADGVSSDGVSGTVFPPAIMKFVGPPHFRNNFTLDSFGQINVNPQDTYDEISDCVSMLLGTTLGQRTVVPSYGVEDLPFNFINTNVIENTIRQWEPRANPSVSVVYDDNNNASLNVSIQTKL